MNKQDEPGSEARSTGPGVPWGSASRWHVAHVRWALATCAGERCDRSTGFLAGRGHPAPPPALSASRSSGGPSPLAAPQEAPGAARSLSFPICGPQREDRI